MAAVSLACSKTRRLDLTMVAGEEDKDGLGSGQAWYV
jgi:hypothetical protein